MRGSPLEIRTVMSCRCMICQIAERKIRLVSPRPIVALRGFLSGVVLMENQICLVGEPCPTCGAEVMEVSRDNLQKCMDMKPVFRSIPKALVKNKLAFTPICPKCDAYALGIELSEGIQFQDKDGYPLTVHELEDPLVQ